MKQYPIPAGAITVPLGDVQQADNYSCGAADVAALLALFGLDKLSLEKLKQALGTSQEHGTYFRNMARYLRSLGLNAYVRTKMTKQELVRLLKQGVPCLLSIQAHADNPRVYKNRRHNKDGHYVIARGVWLKRDSQARRKKLTAYCRQLQEQGKRAKIRSTVWRELIQQIKQQIKLYAAFKDDMFYFMDSSTPGRQVCLPWKKLDMRWHEDEGMGKKEVYRHLAIIVKPGKHRFVYATLARELP